MSNSLVHKSLELLGEEDLPKAQRRKRYRNIKSKDLIPARYRITSKDDKTDDKDYPSTIPRRSKTTTAYEALRRLSTQPDPTDENVRLFLLLSSDQTNAETATKLLKRAFEKKRIPQQEQKPKEPEETVFTEEDFEKFAKEYVQ